MQVTSQRVILAAALRSRQGALQLQHMMKQLMISSGHHIYNQKKLKFCQI